MDDGRFMGSETSWWAKVAHADAHSQMFRREYDDYRARKPFEVVAEETEDPTSTAYRFVQQEPIPLRFSLIIGDVLHALRSALDSLAFGIAQSDLGEAMTPAKERLCVFPIAARPEAFEAHFTGKTGTKRAQVMSQELRDALRIVQPFYMGELTRRVAPELLVREYDPNPLENPLWQIRALHDIDKHRRLAVSVVWPGLRYFATNSPTTDYRLVPAGLPPWRNGDVVGYLRGTGPRPTHVSHEMHIALEDISRWQESSHDLPDVVSGWVGTIRMSLRRVISEYLRLTSP